MNNDSILGKSLGQLGSVVKKTGQQIAKALGEIAEEVKEQVVVAIDQSSKDNNSAASSQASDKATREVVEGFYSKSGIKGQPEFQKQIAHLAPEEQKKRLAIHLELHREQQKEILNPTPKKQEERPSERIEKEEKEKEQMKLLKIEEAKKKQLPSSVKQGTHEKVPGISG